MVDRLTALLGLCDSVYWGLITINIDAIGGLKAQDDDHDSDIDSLESSNCNAKRPVHKDGTEMICKPHRQVAPENSVIDIQRNKAFTASVLREFAKLL